MDESVASYIRLVSPELVISLFNGITVQHLIEKCLLFHMNKEECMEALSKHANIKPVITSTVWTELEKENREFFEAYKHEMETMQRIQRMLQETAAKDPEDDDDH